MFYTLIQEPFEGEYLSERFVCFEADSQADAIQRAEWFGVDLDERFDTEGGRPGYRRWWWHTGSEAPEPNVAGTSMDRITQHYRNEWIVVYKDGNLHGSGGIALEDAICNQSDIDPIFANV